jgi:CRP/FNR family transcriptional regulator
MPAAPLPPPPLLPAALHARLRALAHPVHLPAGAQAFATGQPVPFFLLVEHGTVRVSRTTEDGREVVLYRVRDGESCILTTAALLGGAAWTADAFAETDVEALALPAERMLALIGTDAEFRRFAFHGYAERLAALMERVEEIAFDPIAPRLARTLLALAQDGQVGLTHEALAAEIASAREVVSRQLKGFERDGLVRLSRGAVRLLDRAALARIAAGARTGPV